MPFYSAPSCLMSNGWPFADTTGSLTIPNLISIFAFSSTQKCTSVTAEPVSTTC